MLHNLENAPGAENRKKRRVGRGPGSTLGKTSGRGHKGQNSRSGSRRRVGFEGGQMPLHRRLPKRGFKNIFRKIYNIVNLGDIVECKKLKLDGTINSDVLAEAGLIRDNKLPLKVLGEGAVEAALTIEAHKFSASAEKKVTDAGGKISIIE
ncbi:MAG: 50S ribosomal protein L15 [Deltaproteobacteria bacterium]|jgi:large subunit ribosomal protein L15|nr:50S ribosomal protein L15 [Deltaproteobacteria bacterium]MBT4088560.1 50S ribosomal protein L15 [Deltaproteobacteria bacterium]MBT4266378.1 50S ribosomal protein L15 [Deltaproteobacteria bacterium]MBT4643938.1 50S ribosomal protein L15 [Deltaproteobacteria bacterium]MBT6502110.1 50S ribosomal protein L15 [Deltaproteobacteria bacterium]